jgi:hypothetical protein
MSARGDDMTLPMMSDAAPKIVQSLGQSLDGWSGFPMHLAQQFQALFRKRTHHRRQIWKRHVTLAHPLTTLEPCHALTKRLPMSSRVPTWMFTFLLMSTRTRCASDSKWSISFSTVDQIRLRLHPHSNSPADLSLSDHRRLGPAVTGGRAARLPFQRLHHPGRRQGH